MRLEAPIRWYRNASIKTKIALAIGAAYAALMLCCTAFAWNGVRLMKAHLVRQTSVLADTLGGNSVTALLFDDPKVASEVLSSARLQPSVEFACTYDEAGNVVATYGQAPQPQPVTLPRSAKRIAYSANGSLEIIRPIVHNEQQIGALLIRVSLSELNHQLASYASTAIGILLCGLCATFVTGSMMHRSISRPVVRLANAMQLVSETGDYTNRAEREADDELGMLS